MPKTALVVSGGGSKGAFAIGAIQQLLADDANLSFDFVAGTSTGALIAPLVVTGEVDHLAQIYTSVTTDQILRSRRLKHLLGANSIFDVGPLNDIIERELNDARAQQILTSPVQMAITTVRLQTGEVTYFTSGTTPFAQNVGTPLQPILNREDLTRAVLASADQPVLMPPIHIPKSAQPVRQYVDGGVREVAPLRIAIVNGAEVIYAIILSPEKRAPKEQKFQGLVSMAGRTVELFVEDVAANDVRMAQLYNEGLRYWGGVKDRLKSELAIPDAEAENLLTLPAQPNPFAGQREITLHVIRPKKALPTDGLDFDPSVMANMMQLGRDRAHEVVGP